MPLDRNKKNICLVSRDSICILILDAQLNYLNALKFFKKKTFYQGLFLPFQVRFFVIY